MAEPKNAHLHLSVVKNVRATEKFSHYEESHWADLVGSKTPDHAPIVGGYWRLDDCDKVAEPFTAEWDEIKYFLTGYAVFRDFESGVELKVEAGDMLWIPKGSRSAIIRSQGVTAVYVEQDYREVEEIAQEAAVKTPLAEVLAQLTQDYEKNNARSKEQHISACEYLPGGNTRSVLHLDPFPLTMESGRGCYLTSIDGREYLDLVSEYTAGVTGHSHIRIQQAILNATALGVHLGANNKYETDLAQHIVNRFRSVERVRFCNSGTEANMLALAVAKYHTQRSKVLVFRNGYHGSTLGFHGDDGPLNIPHDYVIGEYNDIESTKKLLSSEIAAVIVEPMQAAGGMVPANKEFLSFLRQAADEIGAVLIFDEVVTSRLSFGGLQEYHDVYPDMTTLGKWIGGGFSFGAFGGRADIMAKLDPRTRAADGGISHPGTFNNNIFSMAAGAAACEIMSRDSIQKMNALGEDLRSRLRTLFHDNNLHVIQLTGFGSLTGIHFTGPSGATMSDIFFFHMLNEGIYVGKRGFMNLNIMHEQRHIDQVVQATEKFIALV